MQCLKNGNAIPFARQIISTRQTSRSRTYYGNLLTILGGALQIEVILLASRICHKTLQFPNRNGHTLYTHDTRPLALRFLRAHTPTNRGKARILTNNIGCTQNIAFQHLLNELRDVYVHRARLHAARLLALQTTRCLLLCLGYVIAVANFLKVLYSNFGFLFAYGNTIFLLCHPLSLVCTVLYTPLGATFQNRDTYPGDEAPHQNSLGAHQILALQRM